MIPFPPVDYSDDVVNGDIDHRLGSSGVSPMDDEQVRRVQSIREVGRQMSRHLARTCPNSWEREKALEHVDDAVSWAVRAISRHE